MNKSTDQTNCEYCGAELKGKRYISMDNNHCICMECYESEERWERLQSAIEEQRKRMIQNLSSLSIDQEKE